MEFCNVQRAWGFRIVAIFDGLIDRPEISFRASSTLAKESCEECRSLIVEGTSAVRGLCREERVVDAVTRQSDFWIASGF